MQLVAVVTSGFFIVMYNNFKPYDAWQNNFLQQVCQLSVFFTLLAALMTRYQEARSRERDPEVAPGVALPVRVCRPSYQCYRVCRPRAEKAEASSAYGSRSTCTGTAVAPCSCCQRLQ